MDESLTHLFRGTLHLLILRTLAAGELHGYAIVARLADRTRGEVALEDGALYQALHRMEERGWLESDWGHADNGRRARFYRLTRAGRRRLEVETANWTRFAAIVNRALAPVPA
jgi:transcriptional regulator